LLIDEEVRRRKYVFSGFESQKMFSWLRDNRAIKMNLANEGLEARKKDEEVAQRKRKAEEDKSWEGESKSPFIHNISDEMVHLPFVDNREQRVDSWRSFASSSKKKKKTKTVLLG
jgi:DnaJ family protein C protein 8